MLPNIFETILLALFIICSVCALRLSKNAAPGLVIKNTNGRFLTKGRQGIETAIGRRFSSDIRIKDDKIQKNHALLYYNPKTNNLVEDRYKSISVIDNPYYVGKNGFEIYLPKPDALYTFGLAPALISVIFIAVRMLVSCDGSDNYLRLIPYEILMLFIVVSFFLRSDRFPLIESIFGVMLTYYIDATLYYSEENIYSVLIGVSAYTLCFIIAKLLLSSELMTKYKFHKRLRLSAAVLMVILAILNITLAKNKYGTYNWIYLFGFGFQPSEIIKPLFIFVMTLPTGDRFYSFPNMLYMVVLPMSLFAYAIIIKDIGVLLIFGVIYMTAVLTQCRNFFYSLLHLMGAVMGCKIVLSVSGTAAYRLTGWLSSRGIFDSLLAGGIFEDPSGYGYQSIHAITAAIKSGGLFGAGESTDIMYGLTAANSDLVLSIIAQSKGILVLFGLLILYLVLFCAVNILIRQQRKSQQMVSLLSLVTVSFAMILNTAGTFGILPLTGIVNPCLSAGISAAFSYGSIFGMMATSSMSRKYVKKINSRVTPNNTNFDITTEN